MATDGIFSVLRSTLNGLSQQMKRMNTISQNIANAERSPDSENKCYRKKMVVSTSQKSDLRSSFADQFRLKMRGSRAGHISGNATVHKQAQHQAEQPQFEVVEMDSTKLVYNPSHPQADKNGYVQMPDISVIEEMIELVSASRAYEANISVLNSAKQIAKRALNI